jgi:hypothetical protein
LQTLNENRLNFPKTQNRNYAFLHNSRSMRWKLK